ncbi:MAG: phosphotransferase [Rothia sp. (in: high G+C Gram-positive bacteria)]|nr:phosphotransferase [Rothia sp. (in: high G+C Gram-positive bacteria)]
MSSSSHNQRITWAQLPAEVHTWVNDALGSPVTSAVSQSGGFSLGTADRLATAEGRRAFLKAVSSQTHPGTANLHRQEAKVSAALPAQMPVAGFIDCAEVTDQDGGTWVVLLLEDIEGRHPQQPWQHSELKAVFSALDRLRNTAPDSKLGLETSEESLTEELVFWQKISEGISADDLQYMRQTPYYEQLLDLLPFTQAQADHFAAYVNEHLIQHLSGQEYVHTDLRADNILMRAPPVRRF